MKNGAGATEGNGVVYYKHNLQSYKSTSPINDEYLVQRCPVAEIGTSFEHYMTAVRVKMATLKYLFQRTNMGKSYGERSGLHG